MKKACLGTSSTSLVSNGLPAVAEVMVRYFDGKDSGDDFHFPGVGNDPIKTKKPLGAASE